jgi:hypothetical protein
MADRQTTPNAAHARQPLERELQAIRLRARRRSAVPRTRDDLHVCPGCASELVYPTDWEPVDAKRWSVVLRCPECEWGGGGIYAQDVLDRFDEALDRGTEQVLDDLKLLVRANLEDEIERFSVALRDDHILAEDF